MRWLGSSVSCALTLASLSLIACGDDDKGHADAVDATTAADGDTTAGDADATDDVAAAANWSCLPAAQRPAPTGTDLVFPLRIVGAINGTPVEGVTVKVCSGFDLDCTDLVATVTTDADGAASVTLPLGTEGFRGFALISKTDYVDTLAMANVPIVTPRTEPLALGIVTRGELAAITAAFGSADLSRGQLLVDAWDCALQPAADVTVTLTGGDVSTKSFYIDGTLPDPTATATSASGNAAFINVPIGVHLELTNTRASDGVVVSTFAPMVVAGKITQVVMVPN